MQLECAVNEVRWRKGEVVVGFARHGEPGSVRAAQAIITLPLSVMQLLALTPGSVLFTPALPRKQGPLSRLLMGPVVKLVLCFSTPVLGGDRSMGCIVMSRSSMRTGAPFPTFWTTLPVRAPVLTAWTGGPNAARLVDAQVRMKC